MMTLAGVHLDPSTLDAFSERLLDKVSPSRRERYRRFLRREDAHRSLLGDVLARALIMRRMGRRNRDLVFVHNDFGKPSLAEGGVCFNVSHSGDWVLCALDDREIGVDVEALKPIDLSLAHRFFSPRENEELESGEEQERVRRFFTLWTCKESYVKWLGRGLHKALDSFTVTLASGHPEPRDPSNPQACMRSYAWQTGYIAALCSDHQGFPDALQILDAADLCRAFLSAD